MALGDFAATASITTTATVQVSVTFTCPQCATVNTTPTVQRTLGDAVAGQAIIGSVNCKVCGHAMLVRGVVGSITATVEQTS